MNTLSGLSLQMEWWSPQKIVKKYQSYPLASLAVRDAVVVTKTQGTEKTQVLSYNYFPYWEE